MRILLLAKRDYANVGLDHTQALRSQGVEASIFTQIPNVNRVRKSIKATLPYMREQLSNYDIVQIMHSDYDLFEELNKFGNVDRFRNRGGILTVFHGGSRYRLEHEKVNRVFNPAIAGSVVQTFDLLHLGAKNQRWIPAALNTKDSVYNSPITPQEGRLVIGHFPTDPAIKGTELIKGVVSSLKSKDFVFLLGTQVFLHPKNIERVEACDIYIEHQGFHQEGKRYGEFGISAIEAAALGKIVISCTQSQRIYKREFGNFGILISNSAKELTAHLKMLLSLSREEILQRKVAGRRWVQNCHSYETIGQRLKTYYQELMRK